MSEDTYRISEGGPSDLPGNSQEAARKLAQRADDVVTLLQSQRDLLRQRGMNLPAGALETVLTVKSRLESLNKKIVSTLIELRTLRALAETTSLITSNLDTEDVLNQVMDTVVGLTGAERGYIVLKDRDTGSFDQFAVARGIDVNTLAADQTPNAANRDYAVSRTIINEVVTTGQPVMTTNALEDERFQSQQSIVGHAMRSVLAVPLRVRGELTGIVYCDNRVLAGLFAQRELELVTTFAEHAAVAIDNARLFQALRDQLAEVTALRDELDRIFESITAGVLTLDRSGTITLCNRGAITIFCAANTMVGHSLTDFVNEMPGPLQSAMTYVRASARPMPFDLSLFIPGRGECHLNIVMSPLADGTGLALVIDDLTVEKAREQQLAEVTRYLPTALVKNLATVSNSDVRGQERQITAMFCDVRGFTRFSENIDPGEVVRVINQYLSLASDAIGLFEGVVDKYMGDAVTGLFNTQLNPQEDHAIRAISAGLTMVAELAALHETMPEDYRLDFGIGIDSGLAVLGNVGSMDRREFTALGEPVVVSKILQENARASVLISEATYALVADTFQCEPVTLEKTKGSIAGLTTAYRVVRRKHNTGLVALLIDSELADLIHKTDSTADDTD